MKKIILISVSIFVLHLATAQTTRYFEFITACGHGAWQDTSFIAATSDPVVIDSMLVELARPIAERKFISGHIAHGNGGHNHNAGHWFLWHFLPGQWWLGDNAIEVCDGCPYSDVDSDPAYWVDNLGIFCPWTGQPAREVTGPLGLEDPDPGNEISIYPNPASNQVQITSKNTGEIFIMIVNSMGQEISTMILTGQDKNINCSDLPDGMYFFKIKAGQKTMVKKLVIKK